MTQDTLVPEGQRYTKDHEWVRRDEDLDDVVIVGITDYAQQALGDVVHVELPSVGDEVAAEDELGVIESAKSASEVYVPLNGKIIKVNEDLDANPEYINESPYDKGWIVKIKMSDPDELDHLLSTDGYKHYLEEEA